MHWFYSPVGETQQITHTWTAHGVIKPAILFNLPRPRLTCARTDFYKPSNVTDNVITHNSPPITQLMQNCSIHAISSWETALHLSQFTLKTSCVSSMQYTLMLYSSVEQYASEKSTSLRRLAAPMCRDSPTRARVPSCSEKSRHVSASSWQ